MMSLALRVLSDDSVKGADVLQRSPHQAGVRHAVAIIGKHPHPGAAPGHQSELGQLDAVQSLAHSSHRHHLRMTVPGAQRRNMLGGLGGVGHWSRVGHREHRGEPAASGGQCAGLHRLSVFSTGFT